MALALVPLTLAHDEGWPAWAWICRAACLPALAATLAWERRLIRRGGDPLLDLRLFRDRGFSAGAGLNFALLLFLGTTAQQFGVASGVAVIGAVFYARLGPSRASSVSAMVSAMAIDAVVVLAAAALTLLLPRRARAPGPAVAAEPAAEPGAGAAPQAEPGSSASSGRSGSQD